MLNKNKIRFMKTKNLLFAVVITISCVFVSCQKENIEDVVIEKETQKVSVVQKATLVSIPYYTQYFTDKTIWRSPGSFSITINNAGNRTALVAIYPRTASYIDQGNLIGVFSIPAGLNYSIYKSYTLPTGYSGINVHIVKDRPEGGYVSGNVAIN